MEHTAAQRLIRLLLSIFLFAISVQALLMVVYYFIFSGTSVNPLDLNALFVQAPMAAKIMLGISSISTFILPAWYMQSLTEGKFNYFQTKKTSIYQYVLVFAILLSFIPCMSLISHLNMQMKLPSWLQGLEQWMLQEELRLGELTKLVILDSSISGLLVNLLIMAVIPAIGEELIFRGCLQRILGHWLRNPHACIWLVAIIFSAIHLQFYGFLPRMLLGALFGYLYYWSQNIWLPILGHFINNASATFMAFQGVRAGKSFEELNAFEWQDTYIYIASLILTTIFVMVYYKNSKQVTYGERLD